MAVKLIRRASIARLLKDNVVVRIRNDNLNSVYITLFSGIIIVCENNVGERVIYGNFINLPVQDE